MTTPLEKRLDQILPKVTAPEFLSASGLGNEIPFFIFDYPPEDELVVRKHVAFLLQQIPKVKPSLRVANVDLFQTVLAYLRERHLLDKAIELQRTKGDAALRKNIAAPLDPAKFAQAFVQHARPAEHELVFATGVGSAWPLVRVHPLLNNLHPLMEKTPLVMFYPGRYDGQYLRLFGKLRQNNYYRAFRLVP